MHPLLRTALLASFAAALLCLSSFRPADACSPVMAKGAHVAVARESAIIVWDETAKKQHFIRRAAFDARVPYFGFLVPTPTQPELKEAPDELFTRLEDWTKPEVVTRKISRRRDRSEGMATSAADAPAGVAVLDAQRVAGYDAVVLKATDAKALEEWLQKHGYATRPELTKWLEPYIKQGWIITAFQIAKPEAGRNDVSTQAVLMSFDTDRPFFPYSEPEDQRAGGPAVRGRLVRVFFVGGKRMQGALDDKKTLYPGQTVWAGRLTDERRTALQGKLKKTGVSLAEKPYLTVFDDFSSPRPGTSDLFFSPSPDQSAVRRPPIIHYEYEEEPALSSTWVVGVVVLGGSILVLGVVLAGLRILLRRLANG